MSSTLRNATRLLAFRVSLTCQLDIEAMRPRYELKRVGRFRAECFPPPPRPPADFHVCSHSFAALELVKAWPDGELSDAFEA